MKHDVGRLFFDAVINQAREANLISEDHFSVDGTLIEAWASLKSFRPKGEDRPRDKDQGDPGNRWVDFHGEKRSNETHESKSDCESLLARKGPGKEAKLCYGAHALMENRNGLLVDLKLEQRLTPGQLVDECLRFFGKQGSEVLSSLGTCTKENPVPLMLTAIGITWMMLPSQRRGPATVYRRETTSYRGHYADEVYGGTPQEYSGTEQGTLSNVGGRIKSGAASVRDQLVSSKDALRDQAISSKDALTDQFAASTETLKSAVNKTTELAQAKVEQAREGFNTLLEEQPLIVGALGVAIGAALGAMLPSSESEDRLLGEFSDTAMSKVKEQGAQAYGRARCQNRHDVSLQTSSPGRIMDTTQDWRFVTT